MVRRLLRFRRSRRLTLYLPGSTKLSRYSDSARCRYAGQVCRTRNINNWYRRKEMHRRLSRKVCLISHGSQVALLTCHSSRMYGPHECTAPSTGTNHSSIADRTKRVKDARSEAQKEIEEYREQKEKEFKEYESQVKQSPIAMSWRHSDTCDSTPLEIRRPKRTRRRTLRRSSKKSSRSAARQVPRLWMICSRPSWTFGHRCPTVSRNPLHEVVPPVTLGLR